jgi:DNA-binding MarR family transcriptional regulator
VDDDTDPALRASRALLGIVARSVAPALEQVSLPHFRVLVLLQSGGPVRVGVLAGQLDILVSTFSRSLDRLEQGGWVERTPSAENRREVTVSITDRGRGLVQEVTAHRVRELAAVLHRIPETDRRILDGVFTAFADAAGEPTLRDMLVLGL